MGSASYRQYIYTLTIFLLVYYLGFFPFQTVLPLGTDVDVFLNYLEENIEILSPLKQPQCFTTISIHTIANFSPGFLSLFDP